ncbi:hypothetical protein P781_03200 [Vibrio mimicus CAIM 1883]|nr:hypothetical protein P781_03200 [Vibrio mimicus CAIM 1883]ERM62703.1 hypothetical protein P780_03175 [Vibrio mimicus CAIM 1882]
MNRTAFCHQKEKTLAKLPNFVGGDIINVIAHGQLVVF